MLRHGSLTIVLIARAHALPRAIVHVGPAKTGSTSLQWALLRSNSPVKRILEHDDRFIVPHLPDLPPPRSIAPEDVNNHYLLALALLPGHLPKAQAVRVWDAFVAIARNASRAGGHLLLTNENLSEPDVRARRLLRELRACGFEVRVVIVYRRLFELILSGHTERIAKLGVSHERMLHRGEPRFRALLDMLTEAHTPAGRWGGTFPTPAEARGLWARAGARVSVLDLHDTSASILERFVCEVVRAPRACARVRQPRPRMQSDSGWRNSRPISSADMRLLELFDCAHRAGLSPPHTVLARRALVRRMVRSITDGVQAGSLRLPLRCASAAQLGALWVDTLQADSQLLAQRHEPIALRAAFERSVRADDFCSVDCERALAINSTFRRVLESSQRR